MSNNQRSTEAIEVVLALLVVVAGLGAALIVASLLLTNAATAVPGIGIVLLVVGILLAIEFGVRPLRRRGQDPVQGLVSGLRRTWHWCTRMVSGRSGQTD